MAIQKRKVVAKNAQEALAGAHAKGTKRALEEAAAAAEAPEEEPEQADAEMEEQEEPEKEISEEDRVAQQEEEIGAARKKELKAMAASDLKELVTSKGLEVGKKDDNVAAVLALEAKARAERRAHEAKLRLVVVKKKEELEALSVPEIAERCRLAGIQGKALKKQDRVQQLLDKWQQEDGISKGLAAMATQERHDELAATDTPGLLELCATAGVDPLLKEVMVDRLVKHEVNSGNFARPEIHEDEEKDAGGAKEGKVDMVAALLANESNRKKQKELERQQEEAEANKRKDLQALSADELKKRLAKKGQETSGKKKLEMVEILMVVTAQEEALAARKSKLRALGVDELRRMLVERKVEAPQKKDAMIGALFEHEEKVRKELEVHQAKASEVEAKKKEELQGKSATELKEMCAAKGLKLGSSHGDRLSTLIEAARADGEIDKLVAAMMRDTRRDDLLAMDKEALKALCDTAGVDVVVRDVVIERILSHESEHGRIAAKDGKPPAKKARSKK